jgi:hypothetical protein
MAADFTAVGSMAVALAAAKPGSAYPRVGARTPILVRPSIISLAGMGARARGP